MRKRHVRLKRYHRNLVKKFGVNEYGLEDLPQKTSGRMISRILLGKILGCHFCFPHGPDVINSRYSNYQRNWKKHRRYQYG